MICYWFSCFFFIRENNSQQLKNSQNSPSDGLKRLILDGATLANLDIIEVGYGSPSSNELLKEYSLLRLLDRTVSPFGERLMRLWVSSPLFKKSQIEDRLDIIEDLEAAKDMRDAFREHLSKLSDLENILSRLFSYRVKNKSR